MAGNIHNKGRRKTIFELDSYASTMRKSRLDFKLDELKSTPEELIPPESVTGKIRIYISPQTQHLIGCVVGEHLNEEYPWIEIKRKIIEDNIYLQPETSDFLSITYEIFNFPDENILIGYDPLVKVDGQFYICVTQEARDEVISQMQAIRLERENRVRNSVNKKPNLWEHLGSAEEIDSKLEGTRDLLQIKHEIIITPSQRQINFSFGMSRNQREDFSEIVPNPIDTYDNIDIKLLDLAIQSIPEIRHNETQTTITHLKDSSTQYTFDDLSIFINKNELKQNIPSILNMLNIVNAILAKDNTAWDIYDNDYKKLRTDHNSIED